MINLFNRLISPRLAARGGETIARADASFGLLFSML
jgi:hypothetical protein